jgi:hypothetical protein
MDFTNNETALIWLEMFEARCRHKKIEDNNERNCQTDYFISEIGLTALMKLKTIVAPQLTSSMKYSEIKIKVENYVTPKRRLVIAERAKFFEIIQSSTETIADYMTKLRKGCEFCQFNDLKGEDEIIKLKLISGLNKNEFKQKLLEANVIKDYGLEESIEFLKNMEQIQIYTNSKHDLELNAITEQKTIKNCKYCGRDHKFRSCPAWQKTCTKCGKKNHFATVCSKQLIRQIVNNPINMDTYIEDQDSPSINALIRVDKPSKTICHCLKIGKLNIKFLVDTGSPISTIPIDMSKYDRVRRDSTPPPHFTSNNTYTPNA